MRLGRVHWKKFEKFLLSVGCEFISEEGDHRKYHKPGLLRPIIIPREKELPQFIILNNLRILGMSRDEYLKIISKLQTSTQSAMMSPTDLTFGKRVYGFLANLDEPKNLPRGIEIINPYR